MNVAQLKAFLKNPRVAYLSFQSPEIGVLYDELHLKTLYTKQAGHSLSPIIYQDKGLYEDLGYEANILVEIFVKEVLLKSDIDLMPEYLKAIGEPEESNILRFPAQLRFAL